VPPHRDFDSFSLMVRSAGDARTSRTMAARVALLGPSSFETAARRARPPQDEELVLNQSTSLCQSTSITVAFSEGF
jgi:hypothetical protein